MKNSKSLGRTRILLGVTCLILLQNAFGAVAAPPTTNNALRLYGWAEDTRQATGALNDNRQPSSRELWKSVNSSHSGVVVSAISVPGVNTTYLELDIGGSRTWIASRILKVKEGDEVSFSPSEAVTMENFESRVLKRNFEKIFFVPMVVVTSAAEP